MSSHYFRFTHGSASRQRCPLLERLLASANASTAVTDWRADAFRVIAQPATSMPAVAAAALYAERGPVDSRSVFIATPVHYLAEITNVRLPADGILSLRPSEAEALAADFNRVWSATGIRLIAGRDVEHGGRMPEQTPQAPAGGGPRMGPTHLFCVFDEPVEAATHDPEELLDRHIEEYLPTGPAAPRLRQLMSEIEMWLFEHDVNRTRIMDVAIALNGLWLWGGGPVLTSLPLVDGWTAGADPLFKAFAPAAEFLRGEGEGLNAPTRAASGIVVVAAEPGTEAWRDIESRWLERSLADLRAGRIARLDLSGGNRCFSVGKHWRWRRWRRRRPWWESLA